MAGSPFDIEAVDLERLKQLTQVNAVSQRDPVPGELAIGFGFFQSNPKSAFSPVAVTPGELGPARDGGKVNPPLCICSNGKPFGWPEAGTGGLLAAHEGVHDQRFGLKLGNMTLSAVVTALVYLVSYHAIRAGVMALVGLG